MFCGRVVNWPRKAHMLHNAVYLLFLLFANNSFSIKCYHNSQRVLKDIEHSRKFSKAHDIRAAHSLSLRGGAGSLASMFSDTGELLYDPSRCGGFSCCCALQILLILTEPLSAAAGIGIGLARDKLGNHVVSKISKGSPADLTGLVREGVSYAPQLQATSLA
jgi:hypothetical protein